MTRRGGIYVRPAQEKQVMESRSELKRKYKEEPKYTTEAHDAKVQGTVILTLEVTEEGLPDNIAVKSGLDPGLDQNAVAAVRNWKFDPALKDGKPVRVKATMEINFRLQ